jgi:ribosomal protein S18 acetylase RimI-like enzyme
LEHPKQIDFSEEYLLEVEETYTFKTDKGAIWYKFTSPEECYITGIWVKKEHRQEGIASQLADEIARIAREKGCKMLTASVRPSQPGASVSLLSQLHYGFQLFHTLQEDRIFLFKEI